MTQQTELSPIQSKLNDLRIQIGGYRQSIEDTEQAIAKLEKLTADAAAVDEDVDPKAIAAIMKAAAKTTDKHSNDLAGLKRTKELLEARLTKALNELPNVERLAAVEQLSQVIANADSFIREVGPTLNQQSMELAKAFQALRDKLAPAIAAQQQLNQMQSDRRRDLKPLNEKSFATFGQLRCPQIHVSGDARGFIIASQDVGWNSIPQYSTLLDALEDGEASPQANDEAA